MLGPIDYFLWVFGFLAEAGALLFLFRTRSASRYFPLAIYLAGSVILSAGRFFFFFKYGLLSPEYIYFYYYSDSFLTICLFFAIMGLFALVFKELGLHRYVSAAALLLLAGTAWFSYQVVQHASDKMITRFVVELSQNLYFVGVVLTYVLWGAVVKLRETRTRLIQLVLALGVFFSAFAANYALRNLYPQFTLIWEYVPPVMAIWLPAAWAHAFWKVPEDARLATARVVHAQR